MTGLSTSLRTKEESIGDTANRFSPPSTLSFLPALGFGIWDAAHVGVEAEVSDNRIQRALQYIRLAADRNSVMQQTFLHGTDQWHACETIDDFLHEALGALGE